VEMVVKSDAKLVPDNPLSVPSHKVNFTPYMQYPKFSGSHRKTGLIGGDETGGARYVNEEWYHV